MSLLDEILALGVEEIAFSGGEPLLWQQLHKAVRKCSDGGMATSVYTSGNVDQCAGMISSLKENGVRRVVFSLFAATQDPHDWITRRKGSFNKTLSGVDAAQEAGLKVELHFVPMRRNYRQLPQVVELAREKHLNRVSVLRFVPQGRGAVDPSMALTHAENLELRQMIKAGRTRMDVRTGSPYNFLLVNPDPGCNAAIDRLIVGPEFNIYPCDAFKQVEAQELVGTSDFSRLDVGSLQDCWQRSPYLQAIRQYLTTPFGPPCDPCQLLPRCLSGCLAQKVIAHGAPNKVPDPMCLVSKDH